MNDDHSYQFTGESVTVDGHEIPTDDVSVSIDSSIEMQPPGDQTYPSRHYEFSFMVEFEDEDDAFRFFRLLNQRRHD